MASEWTPDTLKELHDRDMAHLAELRRTDTKRIDDLRAADQRALDERKEANAIAITAALQANKEFFAAILEGIAKRIDNTNEWRDTVVSLIADKLDRREYSEGRRNDVGDRFAGKTDIRGTVTMVLAIAAVALTIILNLIK